MKILAFAGSTREGSYNKQLVQAAAQAARDEGAEVTYIDLRDYALPLFDEDLERSEGQPENAAKLKALFMEHQGLLLSCPEYNSSITPLLKNTIDWVSRPAEGEPMLAAYSGKVVALMSASPGGLGGLRGLVHVRAILGSIGVIVLPQQLAVARAFEAFDESGALKDEGQMGQLRMVAEGLVTLLKKMEG
jgi:NAD(P)H-dependent FMN reductase